MTVSAVIKELSGIYPGDATQLAADVQDVFSDDIITFQKTAPDALAADAYTMFSFKAPFAFQVVEAVITPGAALTANASNNAVVTLAKADGAGGGATTIATHTSDVAGGNWVADVFKTLTNSATFAATLVARGQIVTLKLTKGGTGVVVPISGYTLKIRRV